MVALAPLSERVPKDVQAQVEARRKDIAEGRFAPFSGRIVDSEGKLRQESGTMDDTTLNAMDYYVQGVQGKPPARR
jgi:simple sugar transport system substrate-binding protein